MSLLTGSEEVQIGDSGMFLKDGKLVDKNGEPIKKEPCAGCKNAPGSCTCEPAFDIEDDWHH